MRAPTTPSIDAVNDDMGRSRRIKGKPGKFQLSSGVIDL
jgi:hypothetical protein